MTEESRLEKDEKEGKKLGDALDKWLDLGDKGGGIPSTKEEKNKIYYPNLHLSNDQVPKKLQKQGESGIAEIEYYVENTGENEDGKTAGLKIKKIRIK